jgi:hypothetical protein
MMRFAIRLANSPVMRRLNTGLVMVRLLLAYITLATLKHLVPLNWLVRWAWRPPAGPRDRDAERRLAASVLRLSQLMGWADRDCLQRSLLLYRVLSQVGADPTLVVAFQRTNGRIRGHAWVSVDGHTVVEPEAQLLEFSPALRFGLRGELLPDPSNASSARGER